MIKIETGFGDGDKVVSSEIKYIVTEQELRECFIEGVCKGLGMGSDEGEKVSDAKAFSEWLQLELEGGKR